MSDSKQKLSNKNILQIIQYPNCSYSYRLETQKEISNDIHSLTFNLASYKNLSTKDFKVIMNEFPYYVADLNATFQDKNNLYVGLGLLDKLTIDNLGQVFRNSIQNIIYKSVSLQIVLLEELFHKFTTEEIANLLATSLGLGIYPVDLLKSNPKKKKIKLNKLTLILPKEYHKKFKKNFDTFYKISFHINGMRQVQSLPGNYFTALVAEQRARFLAKKYSLKLSVFKKKELEKLGAGGILAVNQGSSEEPRMLVLEYNPSPKENKKQTTLALVGKGVTFDTGGISLKPSSDMHEMKYDMSGSGAVLHAIASIAEAKIPIRAVGVVGMVENMPGASAIKPGDVYQSLKGHTVEIQNTDAEGRLVLADLLAYTDKQYKPDLMIDLATLTGAILVALGPFYAGLFSRHSEVVDFLQNASRKSLEPLWHLPLSSNYTNLLESNIADYNNIGGRYGGSSSAAGFLSLFVNEQTPWAHLDIAGIGFIKNPFQVYPSVATGYGVRLLHQVAKSLAISKKVI